MLGLIVGGGLLLVTGIVVVLILVLQPRGDDVERPAGAEKVRIVVPPGPSTS